MQLDQLVEVDLQELPKASWRLYQGCLEHVAKPVSAFFDDDNDGDDEDS